MKSPYNALLVLVAVTFVGHVQSRTTSDISVSSSSTNEVGLHCPHEAIPDTQFDIPFILLNLQYDCYKPSPTFLARLNQASNTDAYRQIYQRACAQEPSVRTCIAQVAGNTTLCLNKMESKVFDTVREFVEDSITAVCSNGSETISRVYADELKGLNLSGQLGVVSCMTSMASKTAFNRETDLPAYTVRRYRATKEGRQCILDAAHRARGKTTAFEAFVDPLISSMKCISPSTKNIVLCNTLVQEDVEGSDNN